MSETARYIRPTSAESRGEAPARGRLTGRRVLVVGGGQRTLDAATDPIGNGRAMSVLFAREGAHVAVADRDGASAAETSERILSEGGRGVTIEADITREEDVARMVAEAHDGLGGLDGSVFGDRQRQASLAGAARAGQGEQPGPAREQGARGVDLVLATDQRGACHCCRAQAAAASRRGGRATWTAAGGRCSRRHAARPPRK